MIVFPSCKINLGLRILSRRPDGYHDLETVFYPVGIFDVLEAVKAEQFSFSVSGKTIQGPLSDNLCVRAYNQIREIHPGCPAIQMHLHKVIPAGAGLGGGSSDGAFTIKLLDELLGLGLSADQKRSCASRLGSDCAFFLNDQPSVATGRGDILEPIQLSLSEYSILLVCPPIQSSTAEAYTQVVAGRNKEKIADIISQPLDRWKQALVNDFEPAIFQQYPVVSGIKEKLYSAGAIYAAMSGSGSAVYGIFPKHKIATLRWEDGYQIFTL